MRKTIITVTLITLIISIVSTGMLVLTQSHKTLTEVAGTISAE